MLLSKLIVGVVLTVEIDELGFIIPKPKKDEKWYIIVEDAINCPGKFRHGQKCNRFPINIHSLTSKNMAIESLKTIHEALTDFNRKKEIEGE